VVAREIAALLAPTPLAGARIFGVDARDAAGTGIAALRNALAAEATARTRAAAHGLFRLAIDRVFTLQGHGTIATGTIVSGAVHVGDTIAIMPSGRSARVRGVHAQNRPVEAARTGDRAAINLAGVETSDLHRGDWLADARALATTSRIDVAFRLASSRRIGDGSSVHVHLGTARTTARIDWLAESATGRRAQLVLDAPICAAPGDRFIVRDAQAAATIGGGTVLDPYAPARQRRSEARMRYLDAIECMLAGDGGVAVIAEAPYGLRASTLIRLANDAAIVDALPDRAILLEGANDPILIADERLRAVRESVVAAMTDFHAASPDEPGLGRARLHRIAAAGAPPDVWMAIAERLIDDGTLARNGAFLRLPAHRVQLSERELQLAADLMPRIVAGGFDPPWARDLASAIAAPEDEVRQTLRKLNAEGSVQQVVRDLFYAPERVRELASIARRIAVEHGAIEAAAFRDAIGLGRKRTIQILEFFDRVGYTRRVRDAHRLREGVSF